MKKVFTKEVMEELNQYDKIIIGVSGGVDSTVLLDMFLKNPQIDNERLVIAHVNHGIREESKLEYLAVEDFCELNELIFEGYNINVGSNPQVLGNSETYARNLRYDFYLHLMVQYNTKTLVLGHHGDDVIETVLMRLVHGASGKGLIGMTTIHKLDLYTVIRPLLSMEKKELYDYANANELFWYEDATNTDSVYTRNRYRKMLPMIKAENPKAHQIFVDYAETKKEEEEFIDSIVNDTYDLCVSDIRTNLQTNEGTHTIDMVVMDKEEFFGNKELIRKRVIKKIFEDEMKVAYYSPTSYIKFVENEGATSTDFKLLKDNVYMVNSKNKVFFLKGENVAKLQNLVNNGFEKAEDLNELVGGKKIKKHLVDNNVPSAFRNNIYLERNENGEVTQIFNSVMFRVWEE